MSTERHFLEHDEAAESWERELPAAEAEKIFDLLSGLNVAAKPAYELGLDGTNYALMIENGFNEVRYKWWSRVPEGWEKLGEIAGMILDSAGERDVLR